MKIKGELRGAGAEKILQGERAANKRKTLNLKKLSPCSRPKKREKGDPRSSSSRRQPQPPSSLIGFSPETKLAAPPLEKTESPSRPLGTAPISLHTRLSQLSQGGEKVAAPPPFIKKNLTLSLSAAARSPFFLPAVHNSLHL